MVVYYKFKSFDAVVLVHWRLLIQEGGFWKFENCLTFGALWSEVSTLKDVLAELRPSNFCKAKGCRTFNLHMRAIILQVRYQCTISQLSSHASFAFLDTTWTSWYLFFIKARKCNFTKRFRLKRTMLALRACSCTFFHIVSDTATAKRLFALYAFLWLIYISTFAKATLEILWQLQSNECIFYVFCIRLWNLSFFSQCLQYFISLSHLLIIEQCWFHYVFIILFSFHIYKIICSGNKDI